MSPEKQNPFKIKRKSKTLKMIIALSVRQSKENNEKKNQKKLLIAYLDDLCTWWCLGTMVMTPYNRQCFLWTATEEGWINCFVTYFFGNLCKGLSIHYVIQDGGGSSRFITMLH